MKIQSTTSTLSEINVTPLVDVMLVLLIVFMISAPLMQQGAQVELPRANAGSLNEAPEKIVLEIDSKYNIQMNGEKVKPGTLLESLKAVSSIKPQIQVFVQADKRVQYGYVARVIAEVKRANISRVGLVTLPGNDKGL
jgi:biopolymer transport protein TolR